MTQIWAPTNMWLWGLEIGFSEGFRYQIKISYGERLHYISHKISAKYERRRIFVSKLSIGVKLSGHFAKKMQLTILCRFGACSSTFELFAANPHAAHSFQAARPSFDQNLSPNGLNNGVSRESTTVSFKSADFHLKMFFGNLAGIGTSFQWSKCCRSTFTG